MNKPQFLAELNQYLTFFTPDERTAVMASYTQRFDDAGEDGEAALIVELGTPMRVAIDLKRRQESGDSFDDLFAAEPAAAPDYSVETETPETIGEEPDTDAAQEAPTETAENEVVSAEDGETKTPPAAEISEEAAEKPAADESAEEKAAEPEDETAAVETPPEPPAKLSGGRIVVGVILSIVFIAVFLCVAAVGSLGLTAAGYFIMAGFSTMRTLTDALFLFAGGLVLGGVGLLIVWFAVWAAISLVKKLFTPKGGEGDTK